MSPDSLVQGVLREYLNREDAVWHEAFEALLARARAEQHRCEEIEADISAATEEARESHRAHCSAS